MNHRSLSVALAVLVFAAGAALAATTAGYLDPSFGTGGIEFLDDPTPRAITPDDEYVAIASEAPVGGGNTQWVVYRYQADGSRDAAFGASGNGRTAPLFGAAGNDEARDAVVAPDGRILVTGWVWRSFGRGKQLSYDRDLVVACFEADGDLDTTFGNGGTTVVDIGSGDAGHHIATKGTSSSYAIYACGGTQVSATVQGSGGKGKKGGGSTTTTTAVVVVKLDMDGDLDPAFGSDGVLVDNVSAEFNDTAYGLVVDDLDRPIVSVFQNPSGFVPAGASVVLLRYSAAGAIDTTFAGDGRMLEDSTVGRSISALLLDADGTSVIAGSSSLEGIARYDDTGTLDTVFDTSGLAVDDEIHGLEVDASGRVLALVWVGPWTDYAVTVARFLDNGDADTSFGPDADGMGAWAEVDTRDSPRALFVRSDGKIILVGYDPIGDQGFLARYTAE